MARPAVVDPALPRGAVANPVLARAVAVDPASARGAAKAAPLTGLTGPS